MLDLANADKHGGVSSRGGYSKLTPRIAALDRGLRLQTRAAEGSIAALTLASGGMPIITGDGGGSVVITGLVVDERGDSLGDLREILIAAVAAWEQVLGSLGIAS